MPSSLRLHDDVEPYPAIAATMARFTFTRPVEPGDLDVVRAELERAAPGCRVVVRAPWPNVVRVEVVDAGGLPVFGREYVAV